LIQYFTKQQEVFRATDINVDVVAKNTQGGNFQLEGVVTAIGKGSNVNGTPMASKISGVRVDTGPLKIHISDDRQEVIAEQLTVRIPQRILTYAIQKAIPSETKSKHVGVAGRDLGRFVSLGTVDDYRVRWNAYGLNVLQVQYGKDSVVALAEGRVRAVLEADVLTTRMKVTGWTWVPKVRMVKKTIFKNLSFGVQKAAI
jgi:hypothetical protein